MNQVICASFLREGPEPETEADEAEDEEDNGGAEDADPGPRPKLAATLLTTEVTTECAASDGNSESTELLREPEEEQEMLNEGVEEYMVEKWTIEGSNHFLGTSF